MPHALVWLLVASLAALWSLTVWALHALATWALANASALSGAAASPWPLPGWLERWLSPDLVQGLGRLLAEAGQLIEGLLQAAPALAGGLTVAAWVVWALGSVTLLLLGAALHGFIAHRQPRKAPA